MRVGDAGDVGGRVQFDGEHGEQRLQYLGVGHHVRGDVAIEHALVVVRVHRGEVGGARVVHERALQQV